MPVDDFFASPPVDEAAVAKFIAALKSFFPSTCKRFAVDGV